MHVLLKIQPLLYTLYNYFRDDMQINQFSVYMYANVSRIQIHI